MVGFYREHIEQFSKIAIPMADVTKKDKPFVWSPECQQAFETLKGKLLDPLILTKANVSKPFILDTDTSAAHVGVELMQYDDHKTPRVVAYFFKKLKPAEVKYSARDREALSIVLACRQFHHYLWESHVTIRTDPQPLVSVFRHRIKSPHMNRWILEMRDYRYNIEYRADRKNTVADHLRRPVRIIRCQSEERWLGKTKEELK